MAETSQAVMSDTQLFRDIFNASPIGIVVENLEGQPLFVNPAFCALLGFSEEELRNKHCVDFSPREDAEKDWALFQQLRAGSINHYQLEKRYFRRDGSLVWGSLSISLLKSHPSPLILAMVEDITDKKKAEEALRASEERFRLSQHTARIGSFERDISTGVLTWTPEMEALYGLPPGGFVGGLSAFEDLVHPDDRVALRELLSTALTTGQPTNGEWRVVWPDGSLHWITGRWRVFMDESGTPLRVLGVNIDITERKRAEEALASIGRRLIEAQEEERTWIARELHDDINQRMALLAVEVEQLKKDIPDPDGASHEQVNRIYNLLSEISKDIQSLSHHLHSSKLEVLGLEIAANSFCREFSQQHKVEIEFRPSGIPRNLPKEVALCLFRVLQEALRNAVKHSGARHFKVALSGEAGEIRLTVSDSGMGFDPSRTTEHRGLGLISMRERVRLVNGTISIESKRTAGTTVDVCAPITPQQNFQRAAG